MTGPHPFLAAAVQFEPTLGDKEGNVTRLLELTEEAIARGARLVVLPEMGTTGYCWTGREEVAPLVEPIPGSTTDRFANLAARKGVWVVVGMPEEDRRTGGFFNSAALVGPAGVVGTYRKTHSFITEVRWARDGDLALPVFDTPVGRLGILICMDAEYPEPARVLALSECDIVCFLTNWLGEKSPSAYWIQRAYENGTYWIAANRYGLERQVQFSGGSSIIGPEGEVLDRVDAADGIALAEVDPGRARSVRARRLGFRRPELCQSLGLNSYLWPNVHCAPPDDAGVLDGMGSHLSSPAVTIIASPDPPEDVRRVGWLRDLASAHHPDFLVIPPLDETAVSVDPAVAAREAERGLQDLLDAAASMRLFVVTSAPVEDSQCVYDCVVLLHPSGERTVHRNTVPTVPWASPGNRPPPVIRTPFGLLGLISGDELLIPELARHLAVQGAEFVAAPSRLEGPAPVALGRTDVPLPPPCITGEDSGHWFLPRVRAAENNVWLAFASRGSLPTGVFGPSFYRFPRRESLAEDGAPAVLSLAGDPLDRDRRTALEKPYLRMRLPHLYERLIVANGKEDHGVGP